MAYNSIHTGATIDATITEYKDTEIQSTVTDATAGRLMKVGAFGLGQTGNVQNIGDWDAADKPSGVYVFGPTTLNLASKPAAYVDGNFGYVRVDRFSASYFTQTCWRASGDPSPYTRRYINGTWGAWEPVYIGSSVLGTVAQSGGVPTGALMQYGSNANGEFLRLADGTQICWGYVAPDFTNTVNQIFDFPAAFVTVPSGGITGVRSGAVAGIANYESVRASGPSGASSFFLSLDGTGTNGTGSKYELNFNFTGRWF